MNNSEINSGVNLLCETSLSINSYYENRSKLVDALNKVPKQELTKCLEYYKDRSGVIIDLRKEVIKYLEEGNKVSLEILENLISKHKKGKENQFRSHKKWFSIFYPPITFYGHNALREFTKKFIKKLEDDLQLSNMVSSNVVDFQGARQQGSNTFWLAIYNKSQKNHSTGIQFFIEFNKGKIGYGVYRHSDKTYLKEQMLLVPSNFKYNDLLNYFKTEREELINNFYEKTSSLPDKKDLNMISINRSRPLNTILYGPPGTGKTYNAVKKALEIIKNQTIEDFSENYSEYKEEYDKLRKSGQIEFVTFHQNYSYEEFVEGIKPETDNGKVTYEVKPGVFKRICNNAKMKPTSNFEEAINAFKQFLSEENEAKLHSKVRKAKFSVSYRDGTTFRINPDSQTDQKDYPASIENIRKLYTGESTTSEVYNPTYTLGILEHLYTKYGLRKYDALNQDGNKKKNYMLIIDEINRGNIAKIFGELITLIEPNKRLKVKNYETNGIDESLTVRLPYSPTDEPFGVPDNLYIIGTMNTADRSIALMDIALRRRFVFEEMMPNHNLDSIRTSLDDADINLQELLKTINERIEYLYDRDHMIGHSYFMNINSKDDLDNVIKTKIIPLLQEYFYEDWEKIQIVLGDHYAQFKELYNKITDNKELCINDTLQVHRFIRSWVAKEKELLGFNHDDINEEKTKYEVNSYFNTSTYIKIYNKNISFKINSKEISNPISKKNDIIWDEEKIEEHFMGLEKNNFIRKLYVYFKEKSYNKNVLSSGIKSNKAPTFGFNLKANNKVKKIFNFIGNTDYITVYLNSASGLLKEEAYYTFTKTLKDIFESNIDLDEKSREPSVNIKAVEEKFTELKECIEIIIINNE